MACVHLTEENYIGSLQNQLIYKDECTKCFLTPKDEGGIEVCLKTMHGGCAALHSPLHFEQTGYPLVASIKAYRKAEVPQEPQHITKLAIGKPGGAAFSGEEWEMVCRLKCLICQTYPTPTPALQALMDSILAANSALFESEVQAWELELHPCEHTLLLQQTGGIIAKKSLASCGKCDLSTNLWLCMTCGNLACGRKNYDGSGGNNHAVEHFEETRHPLSCKLGTITPEGNASVHCYACDDEVVDEQLAAHLQTFGILVQSLTKTEKTVTEMELEQNLNLVLSKAVEEGRTLTPVYGPGFTGLENLGNSCYMNSIIQCFFSFPEWRERYEPDTHLECCMKSHECKLCQTIKLARGLFSGDYSVQKWTQPIEIEPGNVTEAQQYQDGVRPQMFKHVIGRGHIEFAGNQQQDALEYMQHLLSELKKAENANGTMQLFPGKIFDFTQVTKMKCLECPGARYSESKTNCISLRVPIDPDTDSAELVVPWADTLSTFVLPEEVDYNCPSCNKPTKFSKTFMFKTFPKVLVVVMNRFVASDWVPKKLECSVAVPTEPIDLGENRVVNGNEPALAEEAAPAPTINENFLLELMCMGFTDNLCKNALIATNNSSLEMAAAWIFENMNNPEAMLPPASAAPAPAGGQNAESIAMLESMGFTAAQAKVALQNCDGNVERAVDYLFSHADDMMIEPAEPAEAEEVDEYDDKPAVYKLDAVVTHLGISVHSGHYVAHIRNGEDWVLYNDIKVATSTDPPLGKGYLYFFRRQ